MAIACKDFCDDHWAAVWLEMSSVQKRLAKDLLPTYAPMAAGLRGRIERVRWCLGDRR